VNLETGIQTAILHLLALHENMGHVYAVRHNSFSGRIVRGNRPNSPVGFIKQSKKGVPDILCCIKGTFVGFEVKTGTGKQSPEQKAAQTAIEKAGGKYYLVRNIGDVQTVLDSLIGPNIHES
jgi:hypothetical protein